MKKWMSGELGCDGVKEVVGCEIVLYRVSWEKFCEGYFNAGFGYLKR